MLSDRVNRQKCDIARATRPQASRLSGRLRWAERVRLGGPVARPAGRLNLQGGASVSLTQHTAVKGVCEGRCFVAAIEPQAQNGAIELKTVWHDPASV
jgi:hypothetical protein